MLGDAATARRPASRVASGFDADPQSVSAAVSRHDVFRLRRRLSDCGFRKAGSGGVPGEGPRCEKMNSRETIVVSGGFDDIRSRDLRFLEESAKLGSVTVLLWTDEAIQR